MKKILLALLSIFCLIVLCGCKGKDDSGRQIFAKFSCGEFIEVEQYKHAETTCSIIVHKETKIMYLWVDDYEAVGITVLYDKEGKPMLWEGEL